MTKTNYTDDIVDKLDGFTFAKSWELDKDKFFIDATPCEIKTFLKQKLQEVEKKEYEKGFIAGADTTGRQAEEIYVIKERERIIEMINKISVKNEDITSFGDGYECAINNILKKLKDNK